MQRSSSEFPHHSKSHLLGRGCLVAGRLPAWGGSLATPWCCAAIGVRRHGGGSTCNPTRARFVPTPATESDTLHYRKRFGFDFGMEPRYRSLIPVKIAISVQLRMSPIPKSKLSRLHSGSISAPTGSKAGKAPNRSRTSVSKFGFRIEANLFR